MGRQVLEAVIPRPRHQAPVCRQHFPQRAEHRALPAHHEAIPSLAVVTLSFPIEVAIGAVPRNSRAKGRDSTAGERTKEEHRAGLACPYFSSTIAGKGLKSLVFGLCCLPSHSS